MARALLHGAVAARAREDLEAMRRGEVPPVRLPNSEQEVRP